jgi:hypothetical protein
MAFMRNNNNNGRRHNNNYSNNRHRHHNGGGNNQQGGQGNNQPRRFTNRANQVFDSNGPDGRVRGTAQQLVDKYTQLARDTSSRDDRVLMISYWQHAEHYQRLVNEIAEETAVVEREREAARALHAAQNPQESPPPFEPLDPIGAAEGFTPEAAQPQPQQPREQRPPRQHQPRPREDNTAEDDTALPSFLQPDAAPQPRQQSRTRRPAAPAPEDKAE